MEIHNRLIKLAENDFKDLKCFEAKIFKKDDYEDFLYFGVMLIHNAKALKEKLQRSWVGYDSLKSNQKLRRFLVVKRNILLGIGAEYLLKAVFLKNGFSINKIKNKGQLQEPYTIKTSINLLDPCETVTFWYLKKNIRSVVDLSDFDKQIEEKNKKLNESEKKLYKPKNLIKLYYKKPDSKGCLNLIYGIRNNYSHNAFIKPEFNGFFEDVFKFLDFLTKTVSKCDIQQLFEEFIEDDKNV